MKNLISSIETGNRLSALLQLGDIDFRQYYIFRTEHDGFLEQQPQLNHFIPCVEKDGKWVVLEEPQKLSNPKWNEDELSDWAHDWDEYLSASKNVLFDGWEVTMNQESYYKLYHSKSNSYIYFRKDNGFSIAPILTYSDLTKYNPPLTDNGEIYFNLKN